MRSPWMGERVGFALEMDDDSHVNALLAQADLGIFTLKTDFPSQWQGQRPWKG